MNLKRKADRPNQVRVAGNQVQSRQFNTHSAYLAYDARASRAYRLIIFTMMFLGCAAAWFLIFRGRDRSLGFNVQSVSSDQVSDIASPAKEIHQSTLSAQVGQKTIDLKLLAEEDRRLIQKALPAFSKSYSISQNIVEPYIKLFLERGMLREFVSAVIEANNQEKLKVMGVLSKDVLKEFLSILIEFFPPNQYPDFMIIGSAADGRYEKYELIFSHYPKAANHQSPPVNNTHLHYLLYNENNQKLHNLLTAAQHTKAKINFGLKDSYTRTVYHAAALIPSSYALSHLKKMLQLDLNAKHNVNITDEDGLSPLHLACMLGRWDVANELITAGANVAQRDKWGNLPQHYLAKGQQAVIAAYKKIGVDPNRDEMAVHNAFCYFDDLGDYSEHIYLPPAYVQKHHLIATALIDDHYLANPHAYVNHRVVLASKENSRSFYMKSDRESASSFNKRKAYMDRFTGVSVIKASFEGLAKVANTLCHHDIDPYAENNKGETIFDLLKDVDLPNNISENLMAILNARSQDIDRIRLSL